MLRRLLKKLGLTLTKDIRGLMATSYMVGLNVGLRLGTAIGRMHPEDKGLILSARVQQEVEKILEAKEE